MRLPVQVVLCVLLSILIQQDRMKGNAKPTTTPLKEDPEFYDLINSQKDVKFENANNQQLIWKVLLKIVDNLSKTKKGVSENKQHIEEIKYGVSENKQDFEEIKDKLQGEIESVQGDITNVKGDITNVQGDITNVKGDITNVQGDIANVQGDIVDMQNANSALCAYQDEVGWGNNGLSGNTVVYDTTYLETNGASCSLDNSTGKFTAGRSGVYQVSVSARFGRTQYDKHLSVLLLTSSGRYQDGAEAYIAYQRANGTSYLFTPVNAIRFISLQQGETAWLEYSCSGGLTSTWCGIYKLKFCVSLYK